MIMVILNSNDNMEEVGPGTGHPPTPKSVMAWMVVLVALSQINAFCERKKLFELWTCDVEPALVLLYIQGNLELCSSCLNNLSILNLQKWIGVLTCCKCKSSSSSILARLRAVIETISTWRRHDGTFWTTLPLAIDHKKKSNILFSV